MVQTFRKPLSRPVPNRDHRINEFGVLDIQKQTTDCWPGACGIQIILQNSASKNTKKSTPAGRGTFYKKHKYFVAHS
jgi:hypothetical protein